MSKSPLTVEQRFWSKVARTGDERDCWLWQAGISYGYGVFSVYENGRSRNVRAHRMAWMLTNGQIPAGLLVCHHCDVKQCVNPSHLFIGTDHDNKQDCCVKKRNNPPYGERCAAAKLTAEDVKTIVVLNKGTLGMFVSIRRLARQYRVLPRTIQYVLNGTSWSHVTGIKKKRATGVVHI